MAVAMVDRQGRHLFANPAAAKLWSRPVEEVVGKTFAELGVEPAADWLGRLDDAFRTGVSVEFAARHSRTLVVRFVPQDDVALVYLQTEPLVPRISPSRLELAAKAARIGIWDWEVETDRTVWNDEMFRIYGISAQEFTGKGADYIGFTRADYRARQQDNIAGAFAKGLTEQEVMTQEVPFSPKELCIVQPDGQERFTMGDAIAIVDEARRPVRMLGVTVDVTEQKLAEKAREELEERFATAFRFNPAAMSIVTVSGRIVDLNQSYVDLLGYALEDVRGQDSNALPIWSRAEERAHLMAKLAAQGALKNEPVTFRDKQGRLHNVLASARFITLAGERCVLSYLVDLTAYKQLQEQYFQAQRLEAVARLAAGVAHDFNNLLCVITMSAEVSLAKGDEVSPARDALQTILGASDRGAALTRQLLAFARTTPAHTGVVALDAIVRELEPLLRPILGEEVALHLSLPSAPARVRADRGRMEQVLMNLVVNARDAMAQGGRITVEVSSNASTVTLAVRDTGSGIDEALLPHLFEPFFTTKPAGKGTGLGLATVYAIVKQCRGTVSVESTLGQGTSFTVSLPASADEVTRRAPTVQKDQARQGATVLLVEDDDVLRGLASRSLAMAGFRVVAASSAEQALAEFDSAPRVDLLLTDVVLSGLDGPHLAEQLRARSPELAVVFMSGHAEETVAERGAFVPGAAFLPKPFTRQELSNKLHEVLARG